MAVGCDNVFVSITGADVVPFVCEGVVVEGIGNAVRVLVTVVSCLVALQAQRRRSRMINRPPFILNLCTPIPCMKMKIGSLPL